jgi:hypothetical protein
VEKREVGSRRPLFAAAIPPFFWAPGGEEENKKKKEKKMIFSELFCRSAGPLQAFSSPIIETTSSENSRAVWVLLAENFKPRERWVLN